MADLGSDVTPIDDVDVVDTVRVPVRKAATPGWLYATLLQIKTYVLDGFAGGAPNGGTTGQVLGKISDADGDYDWIDQSGGGGGGGLPMLYDLSKGVPEIADIATFGNAGQVAWSENAGIGLNVKYIGSDNGNPNLGGFLIPIDDSADFHVAALVLGNQNIGRYYGPAMGIHKSSSGDTRVEAWFNNGHWTTGIMSFTDDHTRTANAETGQAYGGWATPMWMHIALVGSTIKFGTSRDGANPAWGYTESVTTFLSDFDNIFIGGFFEDTDHVDASFTFLCYDDDADARVMGTAAPSGGGGGGGLPTTPPTLRGADVQTANASSIVLTLPAGSADGDLALIWMASGYGPSPTVGWGILSAIENGGWNNWLIRKRLDAADITAGTITVNFGGSFRCCASLWVYDGDTASDVYYASHEMQANYQVDGSNIRWCTPYLPDGCHVVYGGSTRASDALVSDGTLLGVVTDGSGSMSIYEKALTGNSCEFQIDATGVGSQYNMVRVAVMGVA